MALWTTSSLSEPKNVAYLNSRKNHSGVGVGETRSNTLACGLSLAVVLGSVTGETVENEDLTPLGAFVESRQQLVDGRGIHVHHLEMRRGLGYLGKRGNGIGNDLREEERQIRKIVIQRIKTASNTFTDSH